jgi:hypothetical protein
MCLRGGDTSPITRRDEIRRKARHGQPSVNKETRNDLGQRDLEVAGFSFQHEGRRDMTWDSATWK